MHTYLFSVLESWYSWCFSMTRFYWCEAIFYEKDTAVLFHCHLFALWKYFYIFGIRCDIFSPPDVTQTSHNYAGTYSVYWSAGNLLNDWLILTNACWMLYCINTAFTCSQPPTVISVLRFIYAVIFYIFSLYKEGIVLNEENAEF